MVPVDRGMVPVVFRLFVRPGIGAVNLFRLTELSIVGIVAARYPTYGQPS